jgi:hypothetical protein
MTNTNPPNRISHLLDGPPQRSPRSPAQREAARRNGARGRGPVTAEGKARASLNSLRHGLLARVLAPPADPRGDHQAYRKIRRALVEEFNPATFTQTALLDALAHDYVQLARCRRMLEALHRPAALTREDAIAWEAVQLARRDLKGLTKLLARLDAGQLPACPPALASRIAGRVAHYVRQLEADLTPGPEQMSPEEMDDFERQELRGLEENWAVVLPARARLADAAHVAAVLVGGKRAGATERGRLRHVLGQLAAWSRRHGDVGGELEKRVRRGQEQALLALARAPEQLLVIDRYRGRIERAVERKLAQLRRR